MRSNPHLHIIATTPYQTIYNLLDTHQDQQDDKQVDNIIKLGIYLTILNN